MKRLLREPLLHFVLLGAALFAIDALRSQDAAPGDDQIVVSQGRIDNLAALYQKTWQRPPTRAELTGLVNDYVLEEALYREGVALGVDQDDTIIRRRVRQKMEFVVNDIAELVEPSEEQLARWLAEHPEDYARAGRYRFRQLYLNPERHGDTLEQDAERVLEQLRALADDADPRGLGDPTLLEHAFADASVQVIEATFGQAFAQGLEPLPSGEWCGPVNSAFGLHLVRIDGRTPGEPQPLEQVRAEVRRDWSFAQREEAARLYNEGLLARFQVSIHWPEEGAPE